MKRILLFFSILVLISSYSFPQLSGYDYYMEIEIQSSKVSGSSALTNFPVLIDITDNSLRTTGNGGYVTNSNGFDIAFSNDGNVSNLDFDLEDYNASTGSIKAWVKIPSLSNSTNTTIRMYYGNSSVSTNQSTTSTWSNGYYSLWHLNDDFTDASSNSNNGTNTGSVDVNAVVADGQDFSANTDKIDVGNFSVSGTELTLSAWFYVDNFDIDDGRIISKATSQNAGDHYFMLSTVSNSGYKLRFRLKTNGSTTTLMASSGSISTGIWYYANAVYDGSEMKLYLNNSAVGNTSKSGSMTTSSSVDVHIGNNPGSNLKPFDGKIDEVRVSNVARSADWITTEYNNQNNPSTFISHGSAISTSGGGSGGGGGAAITGYSDSCTIVIDHNNISGSSDLTDFPLYVEISNYGLATVANGGVMQNSNGYDIAFSDANNNNALDFEIESYDETTGELLAWVKVPTLSASTDTEIKLFYGKSGVSSNPSSTATWTSDYKAVWHFNGNLNDATSNNNDGTNNGSSSSNAKLGSGRYFDGASDWINVAHSNSLDITGNTITLEAWVRAPVPNGDDSPFIMKSPSVNNERYMLGIDGSATNNNVNNRLTTSNGHVRDDDSQIPNNTWTHVAMVYDGSEKTIFVNGSSVATHSVSGNILSTTADLQIAKRNDARYFNGTLDELKISDVAKSDDWIATEYSNQNDPDNFYSVTCSENGTPPPPTTNCGQKITFVGSGAKNNTSTTLSIPNTSNIDSIRVEAVYKGSVPSSVQFSSSSQTIVDNDEELALYTTGGGSFHAIMNPTSSITITPANNTSHVHSVMAYVYRSDLSYQSTTQMEISKIYQYRNTSSPAYNKNFTIHSASGTRNITITVPVSELNADSRKVELTATAGSVSKTVSAYQQNLGESLRLFVITLEDVPGNVTNVSVTIDSPDSDGDSFIAGNIMVEIPCDGANGPVALDDSKTTGIGTAVDINVAGNDSDPDGDLDKSTVNVTGLVPPSHGTITNIDATTGEITYLPDAAYTGTDVFEYQICDASGLCDVAEVTITISSCGAGYVPSGNSGYAESVVSYSGVVNPANALGAPDESAAEVYTNGHEVVLDMGTTIPSGEDIFISWKVRDGQSGTAEMNVYAGTSTNPTTAQTWPTYSNNNDYTTSTITLNTNTQYIKITKGDNGSSVTDFDLDAIQYNYGSACARDTDEDGVADWDDIDDDNDGVLDVTEGGGVDPSADDDGDETPNYQDVNYPGFTDVNNDGVHDPFDHDMDGVPNHLDVDADNDGILDNIEAQTTAGFTEMIISDTDGDGLMDTYDNNLSGPESSDGITPNNHDATGNPDYLDSDSDDDGIFDWIEAFDSDGDGSAIAELTALGNAFISRGGNSTYYDMSEDVNGNGILDWMEACTDSKSSKAEVPGFLDPDCSCYYDTDGDGKVDLLDSDNFGDPVLQPELPNGGSDKNFRDESGDDTGLPVELISFKAQLTEEGYVKLLWSTATELNNDHFTIESSVDAENFEHLSYVFGSGNSTQINNYNEFDYNPSKGINYYRLIQTDYDGSSEIVGLVSVEIGETNGIIDIKKWYIDGDNLNFDYKYTYEESPIVRIYSLTGNLVYEYKIGQNIKGNNSFNLSVSDLRNGIYFLVITNSLDKDSEKIMIAK